MRFNLQKAKVWLLYIRDFIINRLLNVTPGSCVLCFFLTNMVGPLTNNLFMIFQIAWRSFPLLNPWFLFEYCQIITRSFLAWCKSDCLILDGKGMPPCSTMPSVASEWRFCKVTKLYKSTMADFDWRRKSDLQLFLKCQKQSLNDSYSNKSYLSILFHRICSLHDQEMKAQTQLQKRQQGCKWHWTKDPTGIVWCAINVYYNNAISSHSLTPMRMTVLRFWDSTWGRV